MEKYLFAPLLTRKLAENDFFRQLFARLLTAAAAGLAVAATILFFLGWKEIFDMSSEKMAGGIVFQLAFALAAYQAVHSTWLGARELRREPGPAPLAVSSVILRLAGEVWGFAAAVLGIGGGILSWFAGREAHALLKQTAVVFPFLKAGPASFAGGATMIVQGVAGGALALLLGHLLSRLLRLLPGGESGVAPSRGEQ